MVKLFAGETENCHSLVKLFAAEVGKWVGIDWPRTTKAENGYITRITYKLRSVTVPHSLVYLWPAINQVIRIVVLIYNIIFKF